MSAPIVTRREDDIGPVVHLKLPKALGRRLSLNTGLTPISKVPVLWCGAALSGGRLFASAACELKQARLSRKDGKRTLRMGVCCFKITAAEAYAIAEVFGVTEAP
jgi:hypothetical protein